MTCPKCGKVLVVSPEEMIMRDGVVVCPQCLSVFDAEGTVRESRPQGEYRTPEPESVADKPSTATPAQEDIRQSNQTAYSYCPYCGLGLPDGIRFCPYCGVRLVDGVEEPQEERAEDKIPVSIPSATDSKKDPSHKELLSYKGTPMLPFYNFRHMKEKEPASVAFKLVAYPIIVALLVIFIVIIYQGYRIM